MRKMKKLVRKATLKNIQVKVGASGKGLARTQGLREMSRIVGTDFSTTYCATGKELKDRYRDFPFEGYL
jgi:hypothetical protein